MGRIPRQQWLPALVLMTSLWLLQSVVIAQQNNGNPSLNEPFQNSFNKLTHAACVTLFHRKGRLGCGTEDRSLQVGKLVYYSYWGSSSGGNSNNNNNNGASLPSVNQDYVVVIDEYDLTANTMQKLVSSNGDGLLKGVLVLNATSVDYNRDQEYHSPAYKYPRGYGTPSQDLWYGNNAWPWNAQGTGLNIYDFYGLPMAYVPDSDASNALRQAAKDGLNTDDELHAIAAEFNYYMGPDGINSLDCLAWKDHGDNEWNPKCLPLGGTSVWAVAGSPERGGNNYRQRKQRQLDQQNNNNYNNGKRPVIMVATGIDSTSLFHDVVPGANTAASSILATLMAAKLIGGISDQVLDQLPNRILFGFFQAESYGFVGSRNFLRDVAYPGFQCMDEDHIVPSVSNLAEDAPQQEMACTHPLRHSLEFQNLGQIAGMIAVDQVGLPVADNLLYVHNDGQGDFGNFVSNIFKASYTKNYAVAYTSMENNDNGASFPPSPLQSLVQLSQGGVGGAVLTGYDTAFTNQVPYHSHLESNSRHQMNLEAIASAATLLARAALGAAYDGGDLDSDTASQYAANAIEELSSGDETLNELANCLFNDGNCDLLKKYNDMEQKNDNSRTGFQYGSGTSLGTPPNYYPGVYNINYGQPFVQVGDNIYGAYDGDDYGKHKSDAFGVQPTVLESAIRGILNDFLGRRSGGAEPKSCSSASDCGNVEYCQNDGDYATCSGGGQCVCMRAHYHMALDEALVAQPGKSTGYFAQSENDEGISPIYTEPFWSSDVGVRVFRNVGSIPGWITLAVGGVMVGICCFVAFVVKVGLKKEKMY